MPARSRRSRVGCIPPRSSPPPVVTSSSILQNHKLEVAIDRDAPVQLDPRLTAVALAHLLENAAQYAPRGFDDRSGCSSHRRRTVDRGARSRSWHRAGRCAASLRKVLSRHGGKNTNIRHRNGPVDRPGTARRRGRSRLGGESPRGWRNLYPSCPGRGQGHRARRLANLMGTAARILLVDDEVAIQRAVAPLLRSREDTKSRSQGPARRRSGSSPSGQPDLIVLDSGIAGSAKAPRCAGGFVRRRRCRSSCCRRAAPKLTKSTRSTLAPMTT